MTSTGDMLWEANLYFNSHPREEDDASNFPRLIALSISTHILTKRMTEYLLMFLFFCIFQLTSSRRGWRSTAYAGVNSTLFQLTSSRRGWPIILFALCCISISTHILTKRMTYSCYHRHSLPLFQLTSSRRGWRFIPLCSFLFCYFNSHPHEEDDRSKVSYSLVLLLFQLTSSRRGWPCTHIMNCLLNHFNSHPHEEDDMHILLF